jgi:aspartate racemase
MRSVDFAGLEAAMRRGHWTAIESCLGDEVAALEQGGAGCVLLRSNTMRKLYGRISTCVGISFFHIADALGHALAADGLTRAGLLGTRFAMVEDFYATRLREGFGIDVILPN